MIIFSLENCCIRSKNHNDDDDDDDDTIYNASFSVLCAHHGYQFDFLILLSNMERSGLHHSILTQHNIHFADSLLFCFEVGIYGSFFLVNVHELSNCIPLLSSSALNAF